MFINCRFIERDYLFEKIMKETTLTVQQINQLLDGFEHFDNITFKFHVDGSVKFYDNNSEQFVEWDDLSGFSKDFYIRKRIEMIKSKLLQSA